MDQRVLWSQVQSIKRWVRQTIGSEIDDVLRGTQAYQAYVGLCCEAQMAYEDGELDHSYVTALKEHASQLVAQQMSAQLETVVGGQ